MPASKDQDQAQLRNTSSRHKPKTPSLALLNLAETFLKFSPRIQIREPAWVFIDIASTSHLFGGEESLMRSAAQLATDLGFLVQCAIADTPAGAQALAMAQPKTIVSLGKEREMLLSLSLCHLLHLEGLVPWENPEQIKNIIQFFTALGFKKIGDLIRFSQLSFHERWGSVGTLLWKRIQTTDRQVVSPLVPTMALHDYAYFDFPLSLLSLLLYQLEKSLDFLLARLTGRRLFVKKIKICLHCEYSRAQHEVSIEPHTPGRNRTLLLRLLEQKLSLISLENPIREFEIEIIPCPEQEQQLDFFEPRETDDDRLQILFNLFTQSALKPGHYHISPAVLPEQTWQLSLSPPKNQASSPRIAEMSSTSSAPQIESKSHSSPNEIPLPYYGSSVLSAPRPTRMLSRPQNLCLEELIDLKFLSSTPIERLENQWWDQPIARDYYFAISKSGQCLWVYRDSQSDEYFLHGYFD